MQSLSEEKTPSTTYFEDHSHHEEDIRPIRKLSLTKPPEDKIELLPAKMNRKKSNLCFDISFCCIS